MITNPQAKRILCFGDSYTWGYIPGMERHRFGADERWTGVLQNMLGSDYEIIEEGLNSRTLVSEDLRTGKEGRNGANYFLPCLDSHDPIDLIILLLGTNETKATYQQNADEIASLIESKFIEVALSRKSQFRETFPKILLISPPIINENTDYAREIYHGAKKKLLQLSHMYGEIALKNNCFFIHSGEFLEVGIDGVHLDKENNKKLAEKIYSQIQNIPL